MNKVVIDLEFSRTGKGISEIIQFGAVMLNDNMSVISEFDCLVKPQYGKIAKYITELTGISNEMVRNAVNFSEALESFMNWIGDVNSVEIYSWSMTDYNQLTKECELKGIDDNRLGTLLNNWFDFQNQYSEKFGVCGLSLHNALSSIDLEIEGIAHNALFDAINTARLMQVVTDEREFNRRAGTIVSLFVHEESHYETIGDLFAGVLQQAMTF